MGKSSAPPAPDYSAIYQAQANNAAQANQTSQDQLAWAKETYAKDAAQNAPIIAAQTKAQETANDNATKDRAFYDANVAPLQKQSIDDAKGWDSSTHQDQLAGQAEATVANQAEQARSAATRNLESYGVDPTSTRFAALDATTRLNGAAAVAGAGNASMTNTRAQAVQLRANAANGGQAVNSAATTEAAAGVNAGNSAVGNKLGTTASGSTTMGTGNQWAATGANDLTGATSTKNTQYQNQIDQTKTNNAASSGIGSAIGAIAGVGLNAATGGGWGAATSAAGAVGTRMIGNYSMPQFAEGGAVGAVPVEASPSRGAVTDDIPAAIDTGQPARINAGEFIFPRDVSNWYGQKHMYGLIEKARKEQGAREAVPTGQQMPKAVAA